jgi:Zn-dependent protease with chaperone function
MSSEHAEGAAAPSPHLRELLAPFDASIKRVEISRKYRLGLFFVAAAMVLLPLVYLGLIGLTGMSLWWHASNRSLAQSNGFSFLFFYLLPLILGSVGFLFMFKPLFAPRLKDYPALSLKPEEQPVLFEFIGKLCQCIGTPTPKRIDVSIEPFGTGASFRRGFWSVFGHDMVLTIGLPMVEGLTLREFAGVLAHELGHFTQGTALRLTYTIRRTNMWFLRAVFEHDAWDERLYTASRFGGSLPVRIFAYSGRLFVFITRVVLFVLMFFGHMISSFMSRQMELDADRYEARIAGSDTLRSTELKLHVMAVAWEDVTYDLQTAWFDGRLADDVPALIVAKVEDFCEQPGLCDNIEQAVFAKRTGWFDTHPSPSDRVASAVAENAPGIFHLDFPATVLFRDFRGLCKVATELYYQQVLGAEYERVQLIDTSLAVQEQAEHYEAQRTLYRYFQGQLLGHRELFLPPGWAPTPADPEQTIRQLRQARQAMNSSLHRVAEALDNYELAEQKRCKAFVAQLLHASSLRFDAKQLDLDGADMVAIARAQEEGWKQRERALEELQTFMRQAETRLTAALTLLHVPDIAAKLNDPQVVPRTEKYIRVLNDLRAAWEHFVPLREHTFGLGMLLENVKGNENNKSFFDETMRVAGVVRQYMEKLRDALSATPYPFEHAGGTISVAEYAVRQIPEVSRVGEVFFFAGEMLDKLLTLYFRLMARIAVTAEAIEAAVGLPRLPDPPGMTSGR